MRLSAFLGALMTIAALVAVSLLASNADVQDDRTDMIIGQLAPCFEC